MIWMLEQRFSPLFLGLFRKLHFGERKTDKVAVKPLKIVFLITVNQTFCLHLLELSMPQLNFKISDLHKCFMNALQDFNFNS